MLKDTLQTMFERDLNKLKDEINLYADEADLWKTENQISNSAGNLGQHLIGNLNHFVGAMLGETGYVRNRDEEFAAQNASRETLLKDIDRTIEAVKIGFQKISDEDLMEGNFPIEKHGETKRMDFVLLHLLTHFNYHLGQINYHRRLTSKE